MKEIKNRIRQFRKDMGLTMAEFAKEIGVSAGNVGDWESESRTSVPGAQALISIANTYDVSIDWLLLGEISNRENSLDEKSYSEHIKAKYAENPELFAKLMEISFRMNEQDLTDLLKFAEAIQRTEIPLASASES
ncbi:MAG: helix-turn-helix domain-containing protein [Candidatus Pristimantibacillus lignocellulolyticus]|uniref:Helix-turn-helix domain-containing protein n=1 Tax=Candidatus Pristimantibacillus lignocellulolyticus TaxID=2994561 RepID=A0A9J6ZG20_9BACL|nr:MAG: helix-turn-helix domain-containing protein [Candidatus Pristimantibacillus lignocellulolyticus]